MRETRYTTDADIAAHVVNEDRFAPVPEALLYDSTIPADAVRVYGVLRRHGDDPRNCYPSHARIAAKIGKSARSVPGWIRQLEQAGWIERVPRFTASGDPDSNGYRVFMRVRERGVRAGEQGGVDAGEQGGSALDSAPKESKRNESKRNEKTLDLDDAAFDEWWKVFPLKKAKPSARKAYDRARQSTSTVVLLDGARRYAAERAGQDPKYTAHPATWLNQRRWEDDPTPVKTAPGNANNFDNSQARRDRPGGRVEFRPGRAS
jgi:hypothetical protein